MEISKMIPEIYYDLLGRIIPGTIAVWTWPRALGIDAMSALVGMYGGKTSPTVLSESALVLAITILLAGYLIGHFISPISSFVHSKILPKLFPAYFRVLYDAVTNKRNPYPPAVRDFLNEEVLRMFDVHAEKATPSEYRRATYLWYDWIRLTDPTAGTRLAKMRAEYRMLEALYVVFGGTLILHAVPTLLLPYRSRLAVDWELVIVSLAALIIAVWSAVRLFRTYQWAVVNHYYQIKQLEKDT